MRLHAVDLPIGAPTREVTVVRTETFKLVFPTMCVTTIIAVISCSADPMTRTRRDTRAALEQAVRI